MYMKQLELFPPIYWPLKRIIETTGTIIGATLGLIIGLLWIILRNVPSIVMWMLILFLGKKFLSQVERHEKSAAKVILPLD